MHEDLSEKQIGRCFLPKFFLKTFQRRAEFAMFFYLLNLLHAHIHNITIVIVLGNFLLYRTFFLTKQIRKSIIPDNRLKQ